MKVLLDENTPVQAMPILTRVLRLHDVHHVSLISWNSKKDKFLIPDAAGRGYDALVTKDSNQLDDPDECSIIKRSGIHHVRFTEGKGLAGLARSVAAVVAAMPGVMDELSVVEGQLLIRIHGLAGGSRHDAVDPRKDPPKYWPH